MSTSSAGDQSSSSAESQRNTSLAQSEQQIDLQLAQSSASTKSASQQQDASIPAPTASTNSGSQSASKSLHYAVATDQIVEQFIQAQPPSTPDDEDEGEAVVVTVKDEDILAEESPSTMQTTGVPAPPPNTPDNSPEAPPAADMLPELQIDFNNSNASSNPIEQLTKAVGRFVMFGVLAPFIVASSVQGSNELLCEVENKQRVEGFVNRLFCSVTEMPRVFLASVLNFDIVGTIAYRQAFGHQV